MTKLWITFLVMILLGGGFLRFYDLGGQSYWIDEGYSINSVLSVLEKGAPILDSGEWYHDELYAYPAALAVKVFGEGTFAYRFWPAVFGLFFVLLIFIFAKELFGVKVALLSSFFISFSYWQITWSRQARWYTMFEVFFWLALWCFYKVVILNDSEESRKRSFVKLRMTGLLILFTILAIATSKLGILLLVVYGIWLIIWAIARPRVLRWPVIAWGFGLLALAIVMDYCFFGIIASGLREINLGYYLPYYINWTARNYWMFLVALLPLVIPSGMKWSREILARSIGDSNEISRQARDDMGSQDSSLALRMTYVAMPFLVYFLALSFLFSEDYINYRYLFHVYPSLIILAAVAIFVIPSGMKWSRGISVRGVSDDNEISRPDLRQGYGKAQQARDDERQEITSASSRNDGGGWRLFFLILAIGLFFISGQGVWRPQEFYFLESDDITKPMESWRDYYSYTPQPDFNAAYDYIKQNWQAGDIIISAYPQFNKIFLNQPGYWLKFNLNYFQGTDEVYKEEKTDTEYYVAAKTIDDCAELKNTTSANHGFIIFDYMFESNLANLELTTCAKQNSSLVYSKEINYWSRIYVHKF